MQPLLRELAQSYVRTTDRRLTRRELASWPASLPPTVTARLGRVQPRVVQPRRAQPDRCALQVQAVQVGRHTLIADLERTRRHNAELVTFRISHDEKPARLVALDTSTPQLHNSPGDSNNIICSNIRMHAVLADTWILVPLEGHGDIGGQASRQEDVRALPTGNSTPRSIAQNSATRSGSWASTTSHAIDPT